jgi:hypothetical protein
VKTILNQMVSGEGMNKLREIVELDVLFKLVRQAAKPDQQFAYKVLKDYWKKAASLLEQWN